MADLFEDYALGASWDEMFRGPGAPRALYDAVLEVLQPLGSADLRYRADQLSRLFEDRGVTFAHGGEERPFPLDLIPRLIAAAEWDTVVRGVQQRVRALEAFLADVYGPGEVFADGVLPRRLVTTSSDFHREAYGVSPAQRRARARRRRRPGARRGGPLPRPRGQPAGALRRELRDREPAGDDPALPGALRQQAGPPGRRLPGPAARRAAGRGAARGARPGGRGAHARRLQRGVLRARAAGPADGRRAGRGTRPGVLRQPGADAHDPGRAPGPRGLPPARRRVPRPGALPRGLGHRRPRHPQRRPRRATSRSPTPSATASPTTSSSTPTSPT